MIIFGGVIEICGRGSVGVENPSSLSGISGTMEMRTAF